MLNFLPTLQQFKEEATWLQKSRLPEKIKRREALNLLAKEYGYPDWNTIRPKLHNIRFTELFFEQMIGDLRFEATFLESNNEEFTFEFLKGPKINKSLGFGVCIYIGTKKDGSAGKVYDYKTYGENFESECSLFMGRLNPPEGDPEELERWWQRFYEKQLYLHVMKKKRIREANNTLKIGDCFHSYTTDTFWKIIGFNDGKIRLMQTTYENVPYEEVPDSFKIGKQREYRLIKENSPSVLGSVIEASPKLSRTYYSFSEDFDISKIPPEKHSTVFIDHETTLIKLDSLPYYWCKDSDSEIIGNFADLGKKHRGELEASFPSELTASA